MNNNTSIISYELSKKERKHICKMVIIKIEELLVKYKNSNDNEIINHISKNNLKLNILFNEFKHINKCNYDEVLMIIQNMN